MATIRGVEFDLDDESASSQILKVLGMEIPDITIGPEVLPAGAALNTVAVADTERVAYHWNDGEKTRR